MEKLKRRYSQATWKVLFALSGNQCAHPQCTNTLIETATEESDALVTAHICHIYAISTDGPRGKSGLTEKELNSPENLILLCPNHHAVVDGQHKTYSADMLKEWKQTHQSKMQKRLSADLKSVPLDLFSHPYFPRALVDQKIEDEVDILRKSRFFVEFDRARFSVALGRRLVEGELSGGTDAVRSRALAWCARLLSRCDELDKAEEYLNLAKSLGTGSEIDIAEAFIYSQKGDKSAALNTLAGIDSPTSRAAALMVVAHHEGAEGALGWLKAAGIGATDLDPDGKHFLLTRQLELARWEAAREGLDAIADLDLDETPVLHHMMAITHLLSTVPTEFRAVVLNQLPVQAAGFPLASDATAIDARRTAHRYFTDAAKAARQLNCPVAATLDDEYALWLELEDPEKSDKGRQRLEAKLRDPNSALRLVPLGLRFRVKLDLVAVQQEIERQIALHGGITQDAAIARFALAFTQPTPEDVANYFARHYDELSKYLDKKSMRFVQIEMLSRAGLSEKANECLNLLLQEGLSEVEESRLRRIIAQTEGTDPVESRKEQFKQTDSLSDLLILVDELETRQEWDGLCEYGELLFKRTRSVRDAERWANALSNTRKTERLVEFLKANADLLAQSKDLKMVYSWSLYHEGALVEARSELAKLRDDRENPNYRALQVNLGIALGDWNSLSSFVANEYLEKDKRSAHDLIVAAKLALHLGSPHAKELIFAAATKSNDDAGVLAAAYFLASNAGWEGDAKVLQWLHKAAALSADDGPIQKMTLKDVLDRKSGWDRRESKTWQLLSRGDIPMFLAARSLNKSLIDFTLFPALANLSESDPRRRRAISAYSGKRQLTPLRAVGTVGLDATALLTLSFLNLLDKAFDAFDAVHVPHSTLAWLFQERQNAAFHQPSQIKAAHHVRHLLATDVLEKYSSSTVANTDLSAQVGEELAILIAEAEKLRDDDDTQRIVVRPSPVHRLGSLMEEEADLTGHAAVMSSCLCVVDKLRQKGQMTADEEKRARAYLQLNEKPWPHQAEITDGAILYLDDLAITYFLHLGILEKLKAAGFRPIASPSRISEANALIAYESISGEVIDAIERIRSAVSSRIESGKIKVSRQHNVDEPEEQPISEHPTAGVIALARICDAIIADDRFLNQHAHVEDAGYQRPLFSTLDLLDALASSGSITPDNRSEYRTLLRRAGCFFVPVSEDELARHLNASTVKDEKVIEIAELKAIRENVLRVRMSDWLQLPKEAPWLDTIFTVFIRVLRSLWRAGDDLSGVQARSNWIVDQVDVRGWAHNLCAENGDNILKTGRGTYILMLIAPLSDAPKDVRGTYWSWVEDRVLAPIKEQDPDLYAWIVEWQRGKISEAAKMVLTKGRNDMTNNLHVRSVLAHAALELAPPLMRETLLEDSEFRKEYGCRGDGVLAFGNSGVSIQRSKLFDAIRDILSGASEIEVTDINGQEWKLTNQSETGEVPTLAISRGKQCLILPDFAALSPDGTIRLRLLDEAASDANLPVSARDTWRNVLSERALDDDEVDEYQSDLRDTPVHRALSIPSEIANGQSSVSSLVPRSRKYFERLVGAYDGSSSIRDYAAGRGRQFFEQLSAWRARDGFLFSLFLSSHCALTSEIGIEHLAGEDLVGAFDFLEKRGDRISQLGAIEVGLRVLRERPEIEPFIIRLTEQIRDDDVDRPASGFKLLSASFLLVDGELSRTRLLSAEPPFYRRLASLSQAALIHRQLVNSGVETDSFCELTLKNRGQEFYLQSLADMRLEPRWHPDLSAASQMKADFFGRIMIAAKIYEKNINSGELYALVLGTKSGSLHSLSELPRPYFPGPLEGAENGPNILPAEFSEAIETQLRAEEVGPSSFVALVNSALLFRVDSDQADLAARALKLGSHRLANVEDRSQLLAILNGLATVAAAARSRVLADELRILVRRYRGDAQYALSIDESMRICLAAAASRTDLNDWREFAGDWLTELAFGDLEDNDGLVLHSHLQYLCHVAPELWVFCGRADAALMAYNATRHHR